MKLVEAIRYVRVRLFEAGIEEASLESDLLLRHVLNLNAVELLLSYERIITEGEQQSLQILLSRRLRGEPLAYIIGHREFFGLDFIINQDVLIPRPETELLVETALKIACSQRISSIADIGTGSGAIAIALSTRLPNVKIYATDISIPALNTARINAKKHSRESYMHFLHGDLLAPLPHAVDILIANLPYVKTADCCTSFEPHLALDGGGEGLDVIEKLCTTLHNKITQHSSVLLEIGQGQASATIENKQKALPLAHIQSLLDLAGFERVICATNMPKQ
jgi:release factor glutamine methyltransferase